MSNNSELFSFDELKVGQAFLYCDNRTYYYGIKVSDDQYFNLEKDTLNKCVLKDAKYYLLCDYEVW